MKFSTDAVKKMAEIMVQEMNKIGAEAQGIREVETTMREMVREVGGQALGQYLEQQDEQLREQAVICECGEAMSYQCKRAATIVSVFGRVNYRRGYYLCAACHARQSSLDRRLGIEAGQVTAGLAELLALAGVEIAFEEATRWLEHYLLFRVSDNTLRKETERFGELQEAQETDWQENSQEEAWLQHRQRVLGKQPGRLYGSLDGVMAPLIGEWRELKTIAWYRVEKVRSYQKRRRHAKRIGEQNDLQAQDIGYACDFQTGEEFSDLFWASACQRQADLYEELVFVCDGAVWIWKLIERHFPHAVQIVDWYHASAYLPPIAEAAFRPGTEQYQTWLENARSLLWEGQLDKLIHACQQLASQAATPVHKAVTYFTHNQKRMDYARFRQQGYFIGSGTVESGGKQISTLRLKRAGARWTERGALLTAKARAAWLSGGWDFLAAKRAALLLAA
jgi:uncharacterized protein UPF0236